MSNPAGSLGGLSLPPALKPLASRHVAVIGAGAAGIVAARELRREGHRVVVFERGERVGGTWIYRPETESDPLGLDPGRVAIHSSMYESLRTNLPREVMGFRDFPFVAHRRVGDHSERDPRRFPGHREVLMYLEDFAREFGVESSVRFESEVESVAMAESENQWSVRWKKRGDSGGVEELFEAVVVCNGHYSEPRLAQIPGIKTWPGKQIHSHNYRVPEPFRDQVVILIGSSASAVDISREIATVAKEVHLASRSIDGTVENQPGYHNMWLHPMIKCVHEDGSVVFHDESIVFADVILHCTGYKYHFPFLETNGVVTVDDNRVGPLYKHVFPPALAPWLSFVGLPWKVIPFPLCELQSKWIAGLLSDRIALPAKEEMTDDIDKLYASLKDSGIPKRYSHQMPGSLQFDYDDWLARQCGCSASEEWRKEMYYAVSKRKRAEPETYRDEWDDEEWRLQAQLDFAKYFPNVK